MNDANNKVKQQIIEKIKSSTNILITVSKDPSVDDLSAAIGLTALLNKLDKHTTAIFSGVLPPAITFLEPDKMFENTIDSLRDFIIALDKEKADHLRYKVEGDVVKIFITPYRSIITGDDLEFSQGDYNIELVIALGVANQEHLDLSLAAHGQILHDVAVATFSAGEQVSQLGSMNWRDEGASSLSEMVASVSDALKTDKPILDKQISTALLTGIVAATDRFSNTHTSSRVMTIAAQLMAAGADQQLIAAKLQESHEINSIAVVPTANNVVKPTTTNTPNEISDDSQSTLPTGALKIAHVNTTTDVQPLETVLPQPNLTDYSTSTLAPAPDPVIIPAEVPQNLVSTTPELAPDVPLIETLNSSSDQSAEDARRELDKQQDDAVITHSYLDEPSLSTVAPINSVGQTEDTKNVDIFESGLAPVVASPVDKVSTLPPVEVPPESSVRSSFRDNDEVKAAIEAELGAQPIVQPPKLDLPLPPPLPDFSTLPPPPPLHDFNTPFLASNPVVTPTPVADDPSKFRIPGQ